MVLWPLFMSSRGLAHGQAHVAHVARLTGRLAIDGHVSVEVREVSKGRHAAPLRVT